MKTAFCKRSIKGLALVLTLVTLLTSALAGCEFREDNENDGGLNVSTEYFTKTLKDPDLVEYNALDYIDVPEFSALKIYKTVIDQNVAYKMAQIVLESAEFETFDEEGSAVVQNFDTANITFTGRAKDENLELSDETIAGMDNSSSEEGSDLVIGSLSFIGEYFGGKGNPNKGFEEQLIGMSVGETKDITVTFPDNYSEELGSVEVIFTVTINSIERAKLENFVPTDEECEEYTGGEYTTAEDLREYFVNYYKGTQAYDAIYSAIKVKGECKELVDIYIDLYIHEYVVYLNGEQITQQEYDSAYADAYDSMYDAAYEAAVEEANSYIITNYLFDSFEITLSDDEFDERVQEIWKVGESYYVYYGISTPEAFVEYFTRESLELSFKNEKLLDVIGDSVTIVE